MFLLHSRVHGPSADPVQFVCQRCRRYEELEGVDERVFDSLQCLTSPAKHLINLSRSLGHHLPSNTQNAQDQ